MPVPAGGYDYDLPEWAPSLTQVATYVPHRTLVRADESTVESADSYLFTFADTTIPTGSQVTSLIADGVAWVSALVTPLNSRSESAAALIAALWAAVAVERGWPTDATSLQRANDMEKRLDTMLTALIEANLRANGEDNDESDAGEFGLDIAYPYDPNSIFLES